MSRRDDDLSPFRDDPVFRALTAPGRPDELAADAEVLAAFRSTNASRPIRRFAARIGTSGGVAVVAVALSGSVAAAYTAALPAPLQQIVHDAAGPIGVPATVFSGRGLLFVAQFAARDLADIGLRQIGPELDLLRDLVVGQLGAAELDDVLGGHVRILLDHEGLDGFA